MRNGVQLITYVDRFGGGDLSTVNDLLTGPLEGVFTGVHLLPFYRPYDRADAGFDPIDHKMVDPRLGNWEGVSRIASTHDVVADLIVNHISDQSPEFEDFLAKNDKSAYAGMFLDFRDVFPEGATEEDLLAIYRPRPGLPFTTFTFGDRARRLLWTTFTSHQVDIDVGDPGARAYLYGILERLSRAGVAMVRLDAIGYVVKKAGTSCFMTPQTHEFIGELAEGVRARGMVPLLEIHAHHLEQIEIAREVDLVYDFALPPLILHAFQARTALPLRRWLAISPRNAVTVLDTHDGIGIIDVGPSGGRVGLLTVEEIDVLVEGIHQATGGESRLATGESASNLDLYQVNSTYYSALGGDDGLYLLARLVQFLCPGIPQVYYAGLLAARNDMNLLRRTGVGRDINRPYFDRHAVDSALETEVVQRLLCLIRFRNAHPAFQGEFTLGQGDSSELSLAWRHGEAWIEATIDFEDLRFDLRHSLGGPTRSITDWSGFSI